MTTTLVCGPPCAGKNTYVERHRKPGDLIVDFDAIMVALSGRASHDHDEALRPYVFAARDAVTELLARHPTTNAWVILSAPRAEDRQHWQDRGATVVLLLPDLDTLLTRAATERPPEWQHYITNWFAAYAPTPQRGPSNRNIATPPRIRNHPGFA